MRDGVIVCEMGIRVRDRVIVCEMKAEAEFAAKFNPIWRYQEFEL